MLCVDKNYKPLLQQLTNPPLLKQAFQLFTIIANCICGLAKKFVKTTTNVKKSLIACSTDIADTTTRCN